MKSELIQILLGVVLTSFTFLYLNRAKLFWLYFLISIPLNVIDYRYQTFYAGILSVVCPVHAYFIIKKSGFSEKRSWYSKWWGIPTIMVSFLTVTFLFRSFFYEPFSIPSRAMNPTLKVGSLIWVSKLGFRNYGTFGITLSKEGPSSLAALARGKIYVFKYPKDESITYVKRLIAGPGDQVEIKGSEVIVNGVSLLTSLVQETEELKYYKQQVDGTAFYIQHIKERRVGYEGMWIVPKNSYFFLGDNRDNSNDSRFWGSVPSENIVGKVVYTF